MEHEDFPLWYFIRNGERKGPFSVRKIQEFLISGEVFSDTEIFQENSEIATTGSKSMTAEELMKRSQHGYTNTELSLPPRPVDKLSRKEKPILSKDKDPVAHLFDVVQSVRSKTAQKPGATSFEVEPIDKPPEATPLKVIFTYYKNKYPTLYERKWLMLASFVLVLTTSWGLIKIIRQKVPLTSDSILAKTLKMTHPERPKEGNPTDPQSNQSPRRAIGVAPEVPNAATRLPITPSRVNQLPQRPFRDQSRDSRPPEMRDPRDYPDNRDPRDRNDHRGDSNNGRYPKDGKEGYDSRELRDREQREVRRESRDPIDVRDSRDPRDSNETRDNRDGGNDSRDDFERAIERNDPRANPRRGGPSRQDFRQNSNNNPNPPNTHDNPDGTQNHNQNDPSSSGNDPAQGFGYSR